MNWLNASKRKSDQPTIGDDAIAPEADVTGLRIKAGCPYPLDLVQDYLGKIQAIGGSVRIGSEGPQQMVVYLGEDGQGAPVQFELQPGHPTIESAVQAGAAPWIHTAHARLKAFEEKLWDPGEQSGVVDGDELLAELRGATRDSHWLRGFGVPVNLQAHGSPVKALASSGFATQDAPIGRALWELLGSLDGLEFSTGSRREVEDALLGGVALAVGTNGGGWSRSGTRMVEPTNVNAFPPGWAVGLLREMTDEQMDQMWGMAHAQCGIRTLEQRSQCMWALCQHCDTDEAEEIYRKLGRDYLCDGMVEVLKQGDGTKDVQAIAVAIEALHGIAYSIQDNYSNWREAPGLFPAYFKCVVGLGWGAMRGLPAKEALDDLESNECDVFKEERLRRLGAAQA